MSIVSDVCVCGVCMYVNMLSVWSAVRDHQTASEQTVLMNKCTMNCVFIVCVCVCTGWWSTHWTCRTSTWRPIRRESPAAAQSHQQSPQWVWFLLISVTCDVTYGQVWWPMLAHTQQWTHTHPEQWGSSWGFGTLLKGTSVVYWWWTITPPLTISAGPRLEPATFGLRVWLSNH